VLRTLATLFGLAVFWCSLVVHAGNPDLRWRTIETEHFYVHYFAGEEEAAERVALIAEKAYGELSMGWGHKVFLKTHVTLVDSQDTANGRATAVPYPQTFLYATAPEALSVLENYDDWLDILVTHELTHVVHLDTVHGISRLANALLGFGVLGKVTSPNILQPRWVVEGVATAEESNLSSHGRRRSAQFDAYMRMAVLDHQFQAIDQITSGARIYPHGSSVYLYGVHFMHYIAAHYGHDKLRELSHIYASQIVPFGINRAIKKVLGVDYGVLWQEFKTDTVERFEAQARRIRGRGLRQGRRLTYSGESTRYPMWAPDDESIYFYKADGHREEGLKRIARDGGRIREGRGIGRAGVDIDVEHVIDIEDTAESTFLGHSGDIVFDQVATYDNRYRWNDLYRYNGGDPKDAEQLTFGKRATEPHASPDGRTIAFRRNDQAQSRLAFLDVATGDVTEVKPISRIGQVYTPRFSPDGNRVAFSAWREGGYRDIYLYDREAGTTRRLTADRHMDLSPNWSPDGRWIVFSSDRDGVFNLYALEVDTGEMRQVSNVYGAAFEPSVSHDGTQVAYIGYSAFGYDLWVMDFDPDKWLEVAPATSSLAPAEDSRPPIAGSNGRPLAASSKRYQPIKSMYPRTIMPSALDLAATSAGNVLGFETGIQDAVGLHTLIGRFDYLSAERVATGAVGYTLRRFFPEFSVVFARGYSYRGRSYTRYVHDRAPGQGSNYEVRGYRERSTRVSLDMNIPVLRHARHTASASVTYQFQRIKNLDAGDGGIDPNAPVASAPEVGDFAQVSTRLAYSNESDGSNRFAYGAERGRAASVTMTVLDRHLGGDYGDLQASVSYRESIPMPWRGHQSLVLTLRGGAAAGGVGRRGGFCVGDYTYGTDIFRNMLSRVDTTAGGCSLLRGYAGPNNPTGKGVIAGDYFAVVSAAYRIPLVDVDRGISTLPLFFQRAGIIPFVDWGRAFSDPIRLKDFLLSTGATMLFSFRLGYLEPVTLALQYAHGFDDELGTDSFRAVIAGSF
jgi:Tol biopolymer transport system component